MAYSGTRSPLKVFYNSACPLCNYGIGVQREKMRSCNVSWNDVHTDANARKELTADLEFVRQRLHVITPDERVAVGIDAFIELWQELPAERWKARVFGLPIINQLAHSSYNAFAWCLYRWNRLRGRWSVAGAEDRADSIATRDANRGPRLRAFFRPGLLRFYDLVVYGIVSPLVWGVSTAELVRRYAALVSANHLEVGVGTGFLLSRVLPEKYPPGRMQLGLMDLNRSCLDASLARLRDFDPVVYQKNVLHPLGSQSESYDSIGLNYVMHCVTGDYAEKSVVFSRLKLLLTPQGVLFGAAIVADGDQHSLAARLLMPVLNSSGLFCNTADDLKSLSDGLKRNFMYADVVRRGSAALFVAADNKQAFDQARDSNHG